MTELHLMRTNLVCHMCGRFAMKVYDYMPKGDGISGGVFECENCGLKESYNDKEASILLKVLELETERRKTR